MLYINLITVRDNKLRVACSVSVLIESVSFSGNLWWSFYNYFHPSYLGSFEHQLCCAMRNCFGWYIVCVCDCLLLTKWVHLLPPCWSDKHSDNCICHVYKLTISISDGFFHQLFFILLSYGMLLMFQCV